MKSNFFKSIAALQVQGEWIICIKPTTEERMTVSVLFKDEKCGDPARKIVPPLIFSDKSAEELDEHLFTDLKDTTPDTSRMFSNMEHFLKQREEAEKQSAMEKEKTAQLEKGKADKKKKYDEAMKKVDELEAEGKHRDAWMKVPDPALFPDQADAIKERKTGLAKHFAPDLFNDQSKNEVPC